MVGAKKSSARDQKSGLRTHCKCPIELAVRVVVVVFPVEYFGILCSGKLGTRFCGVSTLGCIRETTTISQSKEAVAVGVAATATTVGEV